MSGKRGEGVLSDRMDPLRHQFVHANKCQGVNKKFLSLVLICLWIRLALLPPVSGTSRIRINENGVYEDIVVSIGKEVPPIACQQLIQNIQVGCLLI